MMHLRNLTHESREAWSCGKAVTVPLIMKLLQTQHPKLAATGIDLQTAEGNHVPALNITPVHTVNLRGGGCGAT